MSQPSIASTSQDASAVPIPHTMRMAHNYPGSSYTLPADSEEMIRLNLQHKQLKGAFGGKNLLIPIEGRPAYLVLDIGTATGIWLLEIAELFSPSAILHGIDIQSCLFPQSAPPNLSFSITSVTDLPIEWSSKFDMIHQRLLVAALTRTQWSVALSNVFRSLRPGGWIQLCECGSIESGEYTEKLNAIWRELFRRRDLVIRVFEELPQLLADAGFQNIKSQRIAIPLGKWAGQVGVEGRTNTMSVNRALKIPTLKLGGLGLVHSEKEMDQLLDHVEEEWDSTEGTELPYVVFTAQKPEPELNTKSFVRIASS